MKPFKKAFEVEVKNPLRAPSPAEICESIEAYCTDSKERLEFTRREKPVAFMLDGVPYQVSVIMARGGYLLLCKELP